MTGDARGDRSTRLLSLDSFSSDQLREDSVKDNALEHIQMSRGAFHGRLLRCQIGDIVMDCGIYSQDILVLGDMPADRITLGYILSADKAGYMNGARVTSNDMIVLPERSTMDSYRLPAGTQWIALQVPREHLENEEISVAHSSRLEFFTGFNSEKQELGGKLKNILGEIGLREDPATVNNRLDGRMISESLIHAFRRALDGVRGIEQKKYQLFREQRLRVFRQADEYIRHNLSRPIRIADLAVLIGVSQRSLELLFRDYYGVSPVRYLKMRRLHAAREKLLESGPDNQTVAALAAAHGFAHLGRFARSYRQQFGEYPSDTLACTRGR